MTIVPFDDRDGYIWFNGEMVDWRDAKTHVLSHGLHYASLVFEGERAYDGRFLKVVSIRKDYVFLHNIWILTCHIAMMRLLPLKKLCWLKAG